MWKKLNSKLTIFRSATQKYKYPSICIPITKEIQFFSAVSSSRVQLLNISNLFVYHAWIKASEIIIELRLIVSRFKFIFWWKFHNKNNYGSCIIKNLHEKLFFCNKILRWIINYVKIIWFIKIKLFLTTKNKKWINNQMSLLGYYARRSINYFKNMFVAHYYQRNNINIQCWICFFFLFH